MNAPAVSKLDLVVRRLSDLTPTIREVVLMRPDGAALPGFAAGAHITLALPSVGARKYSLVNKHPIEGSTTAPAAYTLAVRLDPNGEGGSKAVHALRVADTLSVETPQNNFPLKAHAGAAVLIAGGIGVTPLLTMAAELRAAGRPLRFVYAARTATELAYRAEAAQLAGSAMTIHTDDSAGRLFDITTAFTGLGPDDHVYMCGPKPMLKAGMDAAKAAGLPRARLSFELFYSVAAKP